MPDAALADAFLEHRESIGLSPTTLREYRAINKRVVVPELGKVKVRALTARQLDTLYAKLTTRGNSPATVRRVHALLSAALHQAERWQMVDRNVARQATPPPVNPSEPTPPSPQEVVTIIHSAEAEDPLFADLFTLAAVTGARRGELVGLQWRDWDRGAGTLRIERSVYQQATRSTGLPSWGVKDTKSHQARVVTLDASAVRALSRRWDAATAFTDELRAELPEDDFIFATSPGEMVPVMPDRVSKAFASAASNAGVTTHLHMLRHWAATEMISRGVPVPVVASRLGDC